MNYVLLINNIISILFIICYTYQFIYIPIALFKKPKPHKNIDKKNSFAILISARNEEAVIQDLLESINRQTYDKNLIKTFVIADNCNDDTALIASRNKAIVYERRNTIKIGKGYALNELMKHIKEDYGDIFDGYIVFDADNILSEDYIETINKDFNDGNDILVSYRNSKNFSDSLISMGYSLWFLRETRYMNEVRYKIGSSCQVSGTGFLFSKAIAKEMNGWPYHLLTEDLEFTMDMILKGKKIGFSKAMFYDEQPIKLIPSIKQRLRWLKGYLQVLKKYGLKLFQASLHGSFPAFDNLMAFLPAYFLVPTAFFFNAYCFLFALSKGASLKAILVPLIIMFLRSYFLFVILGLLCVISEWKHIKDKAVMKLISPFTLPLFMLTYLPILLLVPFTKDEWKPIEHKAKMKNFVSS